MLKNHEIYRKYRFEYMSRQEFSWRFRFVNQKQFKIYKKTLILIKMGVIFFSRIWKIAFGAGWKA